MNSDSITTHGPAPGTAVARPIAGTTGRRASWWLWVDAGVLLTVLLVLIGFRFSDWDLALQGMFLQVDDSGRATFPTEIAPWHFIYRFGVMPAALLAGVSIMLLGASYASLRLARARKVFVYLILILIIGPGLVTNLTLKDNWGRPRPRDVVEFGGAYPFEPVLTRDTSTPGKSFPCGHATMGFFFVAGWFIFRRSRPRLALGWLAFALAFGGLISLTRMAQGGHFASDGVAALGVMWLTAWGLEPAFRRKGVGWYLADRHIMIMASRNLRRRWWLIPSTLVALATLIGGIALATPVGGPIDFKLASPIMATVEGQPHETPGEIRLAFEFVPGEVRLLGENVAHPLPIDSLFSLSGEVQAHGLPWSRVERDWWTEESADGWRGNWRDRSRGRFTELRQALDVIVAPEGFDHLRLRMEDGLVMLHLPADASRRPAWLLEGQRNHLVLKLPHDMAVELVLAPEVTSDSDQLREAGFRSLPEIEDDPRQRWARGRITYPTPRHRLDVRGPNSTLEIKTEAMTER